MIDTHTHLFVEQFDDDRSEVIARAKQAGVECTIQPNVSVESLERLAALCDAEPAFCRPLYGLHPTDLTENYMAELEAIFRFADERGDMIGVGEIGLDFYWDVTFERQQLDAFETQLDWAKQLGLPLSIHCRNAFDKMVKILEKKQDGGLHGIMHCFTGTEEEAKVYLELGFHLGLGGVTTYKNCGVKDYLPNLPLDRIVLETDAPYLAPVPCRGKRNEPSFLVHTAKCIAEILQMPLEDFAAATTSNVKDLFQF